MTTTEECEYNVLFIYLIYSCKIYLHHMVCRGLIIVFGRRATGFHRQAKVFEVSFFITKTFPLDLLPLSMLDFPLMLHWWNCLLLIEFNHNVTSLLRVWRTRLQVTQNLMTALRWSNQGGKIVLTACQFARFPALNETPGVVYNCHIALLTTNN